VIRTPNLIAVVINEMEVSTVARMMNVVPLVTLPSGGGPKVSISRG